MCGMFFLTDTVDIESYTDDHTPYTIGKNQYVVAKIRNSVDKAV